MATLEQGHNPPVGEEIEGYDDGTGDGGMAYPLDALFIRQETRSVAEVLGRVRKKRWILDPDFQREFVWPTEKQSKLIESCIMRIPLPVFYVAEGPGGEIIIVDGLQRITTFLNYVDDKFKIQGTGSGEAGKPGSAIEGKFFRDLPVKLQERILDTQLIMYILDADAPERTRLDIFERVNSGVVLSRQQMRNAVYNGPATRWLKEVVDSKLFRAATGESLDHKTMRDREAVNRFCAFSLLGVEAYRGDMDEFLAKALRHMNGSGEQDLEDLRKKFERSLRLNQLLFGKHAFRKSLVSDHSDGRSVLNIALFDVCTVLLAQVPEDIRRESEAGRRIHDTIVGLIQGDTFNEAISRSTNNLKAVKARFSLAANALNVET